MKTSASVRSIDPPLVGKSGLRRSPSIEWIDGRRLHCLAGPAILFARVTGEWSVRSPEGRTTGRAADLDSAMRQAEQGQPIRGAKWSRFFVAELPGELYLAAGLGLDSQGWWVFEWSGVTPFCGVEPSLSAAMAAAEAHVRADLMIPLLRSYATYQISLNAAAIPFNPAAGMQPSSIAA